MDIALSGRFFAHHNKKSRGQNARMKTITFGLVYTVSTHTAHKTRNILNSNNSMVKGILLGKLILVLYAYATNNLSSPLNAMFATKMLFILFYVLIYMFYSQ